METEFTVHFGKQSFDSSSDNFTAFALPAAPGAIWREKTGMNKFFRKSGSTTAVLASSDGYEDHGKWFTGNYVADDTKPAILVLSLMRRVQRSVRASCALCILPHPSGPYLSVKARLTPHRLSRMGSELAAFRGRGYIVDEVQLREMGIQISRKDIAHYMDAEELEDEFTIETLSGSVEESPDIMAVGEGEDRTVVVVPGKRGRRIRVR